MPRNKPTKKLDKIGNLDLKPETSVGDFIESKLQDKYFVKPPNWDNAGDSLEILAIQNDREYTSMQKMQSEMLASAKKQRAINANRIKEMFKIQNTLREKFVTVNNFIRDCEEKEAMASQKIQAEVKMQQELRKDIEKYKKSIGDLQDFKELLAGTVKEMEPYESVIEEVVKKFDNVKSVKDCTDRCDALMLAQIEIIELEQEKIKAIEDMRKEMVAATNAAALTVLGLNNELAELERSYSNAQAETLYWERIISTTKDHIISNELKGNRILDALQQMYKLLCKRRGLEPALNRNDIEAHLDYIKEEIEILQAVIRVCEKEVKTKKK